MRFNNEATIGGGEEIPKPSRESHQQSVKAPHLHNIFLLTFVIALSEDVEPGR